MALAVVQHLASSTRAAQGMQFDSAGTHGSHTGEAGDARGKAALRRRGFEPSPARSRRIAPRDFEEFDFILAMDQRNLDHLRRACPEQYQHKLKLFLDFAEGVQESEVPDPYYGGPDGFERVLDLCEAGAHGLIAALSKLNYTR